MMEFRVLGPVDVRVQGRSLDLGTVKQRIVLAALLVDAGRPVPPETLIDRVWGEAAPPSVRGALHAHVSRIRRLLATVEGAAPARVLRRSHGYLLEVDPDAVDYHRFRHLVERAGAPDADDRDVATGLRSALDLWHGEPLAGLPGAWPAAVRQALNHHHLDAAVRWAAAQLRLGHPDGVFQPLRDLLVQHPTAEPVAAMLMQALHQAGRTAEALECFEVIRRRLAEDLGSDPGTQLSATHAAVLRGELLPVAERAAPPVPGPDAARSPRPVMLPPAVGHFTARETELRTLDTMAGTAGHDDPRAVAVPVLAVVGPAGVGKTALALEWAHRTAARYPDGQLFVDLRGFSASPPSQPLEALATLLIALGTEPGTVPSDLDQAVALYRSLLAGRRVLVVLDNARDAAQVRPLLPAGPGCVVVVTSRNQLTGLVAHAAARRLPLGLLPQEPAVDLLGRILPVPWVSDDPAAAAALAQACGHLPLALCIAAANLAGRPEQPFGEQVERFLRMPRLSVLQIEDDDVPGPRAALDLSYSTLDDVQQRTFRRLGMVPGPHVGGDTAAVLAGLPVARAQACLDRLVAVHLVQPRGPARYSLHDLVREYAVERVEAEDGGRVAALAERLLEHYLGRAESAGRLLYPHARTLDIDPPPAVDEPFREPGAASAWLATELVNLLAAVPLAARLSHRAAWRLPHALRSHFWTARSVVDWLPAAETAVRSADATGDLQGGAASRMVLGHVLFSRGRTEPARERFQEAAALAAAAGWSRGEMAALGNLGNALGELGRLREAIEIFERLRRLYRAEGDRVGEPLTLMSLGVAHLQLGDVTEAQDYLSRALTLHREAGTRPHELLTLLNLVHAELDGGLPAAAAEHARDCVELARELGRPDVEASALAHLSEVDRQRGRPEEALALAELARARLGGRPDPSVEALVLMALGAARLGLADPVGAMAEYERAVDVSGGSGYVGVQAVLGQAVAHRALGDQAAARASGERAASQAAATGYALLARRARDFLAPADDPSAPARDAAPAG